MTDEALYVVWRGQVGGPWIPVSVAEPYDEAEATEQTFRETERPRRSVYYFGIYREGVNPNDV